MSLVIGTFYYNNDGLTNPVTLFTKCVCPSTVVEDDVQYYYLRLMRLFSVDSTTIAVRCTVKVSGGPVTTVLHAMCRWFKVRLPGIPILSLSSLGMNIVCVG